MQNFKNLRHLVLDAETHYANKYSLKVMNTMEYVNHPEFNLQGFAWKILDSEDAAEWVSEDDVEDFLNEQDWNETAIICHNTPFDAYILSQLYNIKPAFHYDTQSMSRGRFPGKLHSLEALVERLFPDDLAIRKGKELILAKGTKHLTGELDKVIGGYACNDVEITAHAFKWFINNGYPEDELKIIDLTTRMFTQPTLYMNKERMTSVKNTALKTSKDKITASGISAEILRSNDQFSDYVQNTLKLTVPTKMGKNGIIPAFGKNDISFQKLRADHPEYKDIWDARLASKSRLDVTRSTRLLNGTNKDGTISMPLKYYAAHTGRFGGTEKINPQNMKRGSEMRKCLVAGDGYVVVVADKSQIEARLTAWLAGCDKLVQAFRDERDIYSEFSTNSVYHRPITKADTVERFVGKTCVARGTPVLTERGLIPIEQIKTSDRVWDGVEWVNHKGVVYQGYKDVITYQGLTATPDHGTFTANGPIPFGQAAQQLADLTQTGMAEQTIRISESNLAGYNSPGSAAEHLRVRAMYKLWQQEMDQSGKSSTRINQGLPELFSTQVTTLGSAWSALRRNYSSLQQPIQSRLQTLWGSRNTMQVQLTNGIHPVGKPAPPSSNLQQSRNRSDQQQRALRAGEPAASHQTNADAQPKMFKEHVYDIVDAGPRKRYTAANTLILNCILGLGFGVGGVKLQATLESGSQGPVVIITELEAKRIVRAYRVEFHEIPALWKRLEEMAVWLQNPDYYGMKYGPLTAGKEEWILPNGMSVQYPQIEGLSFYDARYKMRKTIWGGVFTENLIQALARVNICDDMLMIEEFIYANQLDAAIALQVHDEVIMTCREDQAEGLYKNVLRIMATPPAWAPDIPLKAEGGIAKEYSK